MSIKPDHWIQRNASYLNLIDPYIGYQTRSGVISYGVSSYGYDLRCNNTFKMFTGNEGLIIDPKNIDEKMFTTVTGDYCIIQPNSIMLTSTLERINIPKHILGIVLGKSTYARCGVLINATPIEPEWCGHITLSVSNTTSFPVKIYANEGIAQILFFEADETCWVSYKDKKGKYQNQQDIKLALVENVGLEIPCVGMVA